MKTRRQFERCLSTAVLTHVLAVVPSFVMHTAFASGASTSFGAHQAGVSRGQASNCVARRGPTAAAGVMVGGRTRLSSGIDVGQEAARERTRRSDGPGAAAVGCGVTRGHLARGDSGTRFGVSAARGSVGSRLSGASPEAKNKVAVLVRQLAPEYQLSADLVLAVIEVESDYNPDALSAKGARGLMQLMPETALRFGVVDAWDPEQNLRGGMAYLRWLLDHFRGNVRLALAGYNAGEKAVARYGGVPPYTETQAYVRRIAAELGI